MSLKRRTRRGQSPADLSWRSTLVVAIGASAGGLDPVRAVLAQVPSDSGIAFVVIQHLDPARRSALGSLLAKVTSLPVLEASNRIALQPNTIYFVPPNKRASLRDGKISLGPITGPDRHHPIDDFMASLAAECGDAAIGVVLSGMGSDGTRGLAAIKAADGVTFAQDPKTAQWPAMPLSAIERGYVDFILAPARIGRELGGLGRDAYKPTKQGYEISKFEEIFQTLQADTGIDFRHYRPPSVVRRILRQMDLKGARSLRQYARLLRSNHEEAEFLADRIFVPLTGFFRGPENFEALQNAIQSKLLGKNTQNPLRIWVAGCSTGQEVYSIAMLVAEKMGANANQDAVQVFGTDIRERAVQHARAGVYSQVAVAGVAAGRLKRFFVKSYGGYRVSQGLREMCVFARHDLATDPPFSNLDLISCRNVLPYLRLPFQGRVLKAFHYALKPRAFLFTDSASVVKASSRFTIRDHKHGILSRMPDAPDMVGLARSVAQPRRKEHGARIAATAPSTARAALMTTNGQLSATIEELETANEELRASKQEIVALSSELRESNLALSALAHDLGTLLTGVDIPVLVLDSRLCIERFTLAAATLFHLDSRQVGAPFLHAASNLGALPWEALLVDVTRYGRSIERTFQHRNGRWYSLRMKPFGETKKAFSGVLIVLLDEDTVRRALLEATGSLAESASTVRMLMDTSPQGIVAVDAGGTIVWANNTASTMFGYGSSELLGKPLQILVPEPHRNGHAEHRKTFFAHPKSRPMGIGLEFQGRRKDGTLFPVEVGLGVTKSRAGKLGAAFITDITERKRLDDAIRQRESELVALFDSSPDTKLRFDSKLRVTHANLAFAKLTGTSRQAIIGKTSRELPLPRASVQAANRLIAEVFRTGQPQRHELSLALATGVTEHDVRYVPELASDGSVAAVLAVGRDITDEKRVERALRSREQELAALFDNSPDVILRLDRNFRYLYINAAWERMTGISRETALGKTGEELGTPAATVKIRERGLRQVFKSGSSMTLEFTFATKGGPIDQEVRYIPEFDAGIVSSVLLIGRDITEQKRLQRLADAYARDIRDLSARLMTAQEEERRRLARDIHDSLCQHLGALAAEISRVAADLPASSPALPGLRAVREGALRSAEEARQIARRLHPAILEDLGLRKALQNLCHEFSQQEGIQVKFRVRGPLPPVPIEAASCAYRIAQEALHNVARHARAKHAWVVLAGRRDLHLSISDDGIAFDPMAVRRSGQLGLVGMRERARLANGELSVDSKPGRGTRVSLAVRLPRDDS